MSRKPIQSEGSPAYSILQSGLVKASLFKISTEGTVEQNQLGILLLNPTTWQESKSVNWASHNVPGQSDPIKQFTSGGARTVTFDALVTKDTSDLGKNQSQLFSNIISKGINAVSSIASNFFDVSVPPLQDVFNTLLGNNAFDNPLDISEHLNYFRSLAYPTYDQNGELTSSPPLLALHVGTSFTRQNNEPIISLNSTNHIWILKNININITKQLPSLAPMEAVVSIQLEQYIIQSISSNDFNGTSRTGGINDNLPIVGSGSSFAT